jgi:hypothetical protein
VPFFVVDVLGPWFMAFLCVSQQGELKTPQNVLEKYMSKTFYKKTVFFLSVIFSSDFFNRVFCMRSSKYHKNIFLTKKAPENLKTNRGKNREVGMSFFGFFFQRPLTSAALAIGRGWCRPPPLRWSSISAAYRAPA